MLESMTAGLHLLLYTLGLIGPSDLASIGAFGVAVAVVSAAAMLVSLLALILPSAGSLSSTHATRAIDVSSPLSQSDPDASGHPRPRAPGFAALAA